MWYRWQKGRQNTGYEKMILFKFLFFDLYLLRYKKGSFIPNHLDEVSRGRHFRLNIVLKRSEGGNFICPDSFINSTRFKFFRPDIHEHSVSEVLSGTRYVFSFGWIMP